MLGGLCAKRLIYWLGSLLLWTRLETILKKFPKMIDSDHRYKQMHISKAGWTLVRGREGTMVMLLIVTPAILDSVRGF